MKDILDAVWKAIKAVDWKSIAYNALMNDVIPELQKMAAASDSKVDDIMVDGVKHFVDAFLKPDPDPAPDPAPSA